MAAGNILQTAIGIGVFDQGVVGVGLENPSDRYRFCWDWRRRPIGLVNPPNGFTALVFVSIAMLVAAGVTWLLTALRDRWQHRKSRQGA
jgi:hypothetical protein